MKFPYLRPQLPEPEHWVPLLKQSYQQHYFSNFGPLATRLETEISENYLVNDYETTVVASNTLGQVAVLQALEVTNKYVILPDFTFAGTLQAVISAGAKPLVCDVEPSTGELCPKHLQETLEKYDEVAAIIFVRCYGFVNDISTIRNICRNADIPLVIDAAAALGDPDLQEFGSEDGEIEVFSLHATKVFAIGEGGAIAAPKSIMPKIRRCVNFGFMPDRTFHDGTNAKLDEFRAAIGIATIPIIKTLVAQRQTHAEHYINLCKDFDEVSLFNMPETASWSCFPLMLAKSSQMSAVNIFADHGIEIKKYYWPGITAAYQGNSHIETLGTPISNTIQNQVICLPIYSEPIDTFWKSLEPAIKSALSSLSET